MLFAKAGTAQNGCQEKFGAEQNGQAKKLGELQKKSVAELKRLFINFNLNPKVERLQLLTIMSQKQ